MIPKIIHYCWFGKNPIPEKVKKCIESWKRLCPDYKIICWNEENFDIEQFEYTKQAYSAKKWAFVSDVVRIKVIYEYGGIYLDTDVELIKNLDDLLVYDSFWAFENEKHIATGLGFGAVAQNKYVKLLLDDYSTRSFFDDKGVPNVIPCTDLNTQVFKNEGIAINNSLQVIDNNIFLPTEYMCPIDYETGKKNITHNTISIHHYDATWHTRKENFLHNFEKYSRRILGKRISKKLTNFVILLTNGGIIAVFNKIREKK